MNMDVQTMKRGEGCGVSNGLDRDHVDIVVDHVDKMFPRNISSPDTNKDKQPEHHYTSTCKIAQ